MESQAAGHPSADAAAGRPEPDCQYSTIQPHGSGQTELPQAEEEEEDEVQYVTVYHRKPGEWWVIPHTQWLRELISMTVCDHKRSQIKPWSQFGPIVKVFLYYGKVICSMFKNYKETPGIKTNVRDWGFGSFLSIILFVTKF